MLYKITYLPLILLVLLSSCKKNNPIKQPIASENHVAYDWFKYTGKDKFFKSNKKNEYNNPILSGFYPDPSICRVGDDFYLINSSFSYFPGIPIFKSKDLVSWNQIGHVISRKEQASLDSGVSKGMFAPTIRYNNGTFYVICTNVNSKGNFIVTAKNPEGPWSDPIWLEGVEGIDPDIFFDDDGKVYITHNGPPPNNISLHEGHRAIYTFEYDLKDQKIVGDSKLIVNGGTDLSKKPVWIEAPHIIKKEGYYYLICAEGGTGFNHSEVVFRSKNIFGPYEVYEDNPILTQRHLKNNLITTTGHADFVELQNGDWWAVFLGCRPYEGDFYNTGRETFLMPVEWENGWPKVVNGKKEIPVVNTRPNLKVSEDAITTSGNFDWIDNFENEKLGFEWNFMRTPSDKWHKLENNLLQIKFRDINIKEEKNFSFIGRRQQHLEFSASTKVLFDFKNIEQTAGLVAFQNEKHYLYLGVKLNADNNVEVFVEKADSKAQETLEIIHKKLINPKNQKEIILKIEGKNRYYSFYYKLNEEDKWISITENVDAKLLSTREAGGFVGTYLGMYTSNNHFKSL